MKVLFTGDLHFGHENVLKFDGRPFDTVEEMDTELIRRWNNKVDKGDLVYVLGDMIWKTRNDDAPGLIKSLNGQIILIKGNHDRFLHNAKAKAALAGLKDYDDICVHWKMGRRKESFSRTSSSPCITDIATRRSTCMPTPTSQTKQTTKLTSPRNSIAKVAKTRFTMWAVCTGTMNP